MYEVVLKKKICVFGGAKSGKNPKQIEWIPNRAFVFSRNDNTWHSYKADGKQNRLALVYNLRSDKYWKK